MMDEKTLRELAEEFDHTDQSASIERAELATPPEGTPMVVTSMRLPEPVMRMVRRQARQRGLKATQLMREWIEERAAQDMELADSSIPTSALLAFVAEHARKRPA